MTQQQWRQFEELIENVTEEDRRAMLRRIEERARQARDESRSTEDEEALGRRQREALKELAERVAKIDEHSPNDGLSNRDHDHIIYGDAS
jgi:hypothetical protein